MSAHTTEVIVGGVVVAAAAGFLVYASQFSGVSTTAGSYDLTASFRSAEGVTVGTDVRLAGVKVGTVTGLELDTDSFRATAQFAIDNDVRLPDDTSLVIASEGLLGGTFVEVLPGGSDFEYEPGDQVLDTESSVSIISLLLNFVAGDGSE